jgi:hypothetical protein
MDVNCKGENRNDFILEDYFIQHFFFFQTSIQCEEQFGIAACIQISNVYCLCMLNAESGGLPIGVDGRVQKLALIGCELLGIVI